MLAREADTSLLNAKNALIAYHGRYDRAFSALMNGIDFTNLNTDKLRIAELERTVQDLQEKLDALEHDYDSFKKFVRNNTKIDWSRYGMG